MWLIEVPDISVSLCGELLGPEPRSAKKYTAELVTQTAFSGAAFIISHPDQANDANAVYLAGVEGALQAYTAIREKNPKYSWPSLDELLVKKEKGELAAAVATAAAKCK
jgi:hypothetical protein